MVKINVGSPYVRFVGSRDDDLFPLCEGSCVSNVVPVNISGHGSFFDDDVDAGRG